MKKFKRVGSIIISCIIAISASASPMRTFADEAEKLSIDDFEIQLDDDKDGIVTDKIIVNNNGDKISRDLKDKMKEATKDEPIPIYIFRKLIPDKTIGELVTKETGIDYRNYEDRDRFNTFVIPEIAKEVMNRVGAEKAAMKDQDTMMSPIDIAVSENVSNFKKERLEIVKREYSNANDAFVRDNLNKDREVRVNSRYFPVIITEATVEEILKLSTLSDVDNIMYYEDLELESNLDKSLSIVNADKVKSSTYNNGSGYKGSGIKIGVIESKNKISKNVYTNGGKFDSNSPHLKNIPSSRLQYKENKYSDGSCVPYEILDHATVVTSIIIGREVIDSKGNKFEGVVPLSTVYQTSSTKPSETIMAYEMLADLNVDVINNSNGNDTEGYTGYDCLMDYAIATTKIPFVVSAGNTGLESKNINSPAKALNAITVGNAQIRDYDEKTKKISDKSSPYPIFDESSYEEPNYFPNKPDIVAPGAYIGVVSCENGKNVAGYWKGTSFSAPIVTGVIAQLMQRDPFCRLDPLIVKSVIMLYANSSLISPKNNPKVDYTYICEKSGVGMIDAEKCLSRYYGFSGTITMLYKDTPNVLKERSREKVTLKKGQKIRILLTFGKNGKNKIESKNDLENLDLYLYNPSKVIEKSSTSKRNNTEIIEYTATKNGVYSIEIQGMSIKDEDLGVPYALAYYIQ